MTSPSSPPQRPRSRAGGGGSNGGPRRSRAVAALASRSLARLAVEPGADLAGEAQLAVLVDAHGHRAEIAGVALARRPAADHELLLGPDLELEPRRRAPARLVARAPELGDDALEPLAAAASWNAMPSPSTWAAKRTRGCVRSTLSQQPLAILERDVEQRPPVEVQQVERLVDEARPRPGSTELAPGAARSRAARPRRGPRPRRRRSPRRASIQLGGDEQPREVGLGVVAGCGSRSGPCRRATTAWTR